MAKIEGGCACGQIRYTSEADPVMVVNCYCEDCRKTSGGAFSFNLVMPAGSVTVTGADALSWRVKAVPKWWCVDRLSSLSCELPGARSRLSCD